MDTLLTVFLHTKKPSHSTGVLVERDGFEPSKSVTTDLQSAPFGHSGTYPRLCYRSDHQMELAMGLEPATC